MATENIPFKYFGVKLLGLWVISGEPPFGMRDEDTTITRALHGSKYTVTC